jgi:hypothetical protein
MNIFKNFYDFFFVLVNICEELYQWLFTPVKLFNWNVTPIFISGSVLVSIMVFKFTKMLIWR